MIPTVTFVITCITAVISFVTLTVKLTRYITEQEVPTYDDNGEQIGTEMQETEFDNSDYCIAGDITDHRDGRITVKMGALTEVEQAYELMLGGM